MVSGDASFRRYFRFAHQQQSIIAVDAPPAHENNPGFVQIGRLLKDNGIHVPDFFATDFEQGFLLLSDFGDQLLLPLLDAKTVDGFYGQAMATLLNIQQVPMTSLKTLPDYSAEKLDVELNLCNQWFLERHLQLSLSAKEQETLTEVYRQLIQSAAAQPQVLVHRDFHSRNLMVCHSGKLGVLDFQDAVVGPISYDLVSLLKDCYICWPEDKVTGWVRRYHQLATERSLITVEFDEFFRQFEWMGMQRHIKVLGIFARLNYRDQKSGYLKDLPLTFDYLLSASARYREFDAFHRLLTAKILPSLESLS